MPRSGFREVGEGGVVDVARRLEWEDVVLVSATLAAERLPRTECCW